jgi:hypothetical protein
LDKKLYSALDSIKLAQFIKNNNQSGALVDYRVMGHVAASCYHITIVITGGESEFEREEEITDGSNSNNTICYIVYFLAISRYWFQLKK